VASAEGAKHMTLGRGEAAYISVASAEGAKHMTLGRGEAALYSVVQAGEAASYSDGG
jgi:hypothetical protein